MSRKETGIGKTVNLCRKLEGEVAELATELVEKWKALVSENENYVSSRGNSSEYKKDACVQKANFLGRFLKIPQSPFVAHP